MMQIVIMVEGDRPCGWPARRQSSDMTD